MRGRFHADDEGQKAVRDAVLGPCLYGKFALEGRYVFIDKGRLASILQKRYAVDTFIQSRKDGSAVGIEEKIVRCDPETGRIYTAMTLETDSCTVPGRESPGWMKYGEADLLNYAMCRKDGNVVCFLVDFQKLKDVFWEEIRSREADGIPTFRVTRTTGQGNDTECRIVPVYWIQGAVGLKRVKLFPDNTGKESVIAYNQTHYKNVGKKWGEEYLKAPTFNFEGSAF